MKGNNNTPGHTPPADDVEEHQRDLSVVVPMFNEEENVEYLYQRLTDTLKSYGKSYEIVFVEDGSTDGTFTLLQDLYERDPAVRVIRFARNFGQQMATAAGLRYARGEVIVLIDADMQTAPEDIPMLVDELAKGYDIVYGVRQKRRDPLWRRLGSWGVSHMLYRVTGVDVPDSASGFIALDREFVNHINLFNEKAKFLSGLFAWLSYGRCGAVPVSHSPRHAGESKYGFTKLAASALNFICNFTAMPLHLALYFGWLVLVLSFLGFLVLVATRLLGSTVLNEPTWFLVAVVAFFSGVQLISVGVLGAYLGRVYREVKEQPAFVIRELLERDKSPTQ